MEKHHALRLNINIFLGGFQISKSTLRQHYERTRNKITLQFSVFSDWQIVIKCHYT